MQGSGTDNDPKVGLSLLKRYLRAHLAELALYDKVPAHLCGASNVCCIRKALEVQPPECLFGAEKPREVSTVLTHLLLYGAGHSDC